jgi:type IV secretion system protein VirB9
MSAMDWRSLKFCVFSLYLVIAGVKAEVIPGRGAGDSRLRNVVYDPQQVIRLQGYVGYQIELEFAPGERFVNLAAGDTAVLEVGTVEQHLMIKPRASVAGTNITIFTNRRVYHLHYRATRSPPSPAGGEVIYAVRFIYAPDAEPKPLEDEVRAGLARSAHLRARNLQYDYCGPEALKPVSVYDDGVQTRLTFRPRADIPAIFVRDSVGAESLVNFHVEGETVVVHQVASQFVLRRGRLVACLVNSGFDGGGLALDSGTLAPEIQRRVEQVAP